MELSLISLILIAAAAKFGQMNASYRESLVEAAELRLTLKSVAREGGVIDYCEKTQAGSNKQVKAFSCSVFVTANCADKDSTAVCSVCDLSTRSKKYLRRYRVSLGCLLTSDSTHISFNIFDVLPKSNDTLKKRNMSSR